VDEKSRYVWLPGIFCCGPFLDAMLSQGRVHPTFASRLQRMAVDITPQWRGSPVGIGAMWGFIPSDGHIGPHLTTLHDQFTYQPGTPRPSSIDRRADLKMNKDNNIRYLLQW
jgi:hypothetical protein